MRKIIFILLILLLNCMPDTYFIGTKAEFLSMGFTEDQIKKIEVIDKGNQKYTKIFYK